MACTYIVIVVHLLECVGFTFDADCETITSFDCTNDLVAGICFCIRRGDPSESEPAVCRKELEKANCRIEVVNDGLVCVGNTFRAQRAVGKCGIRSVQKLVRESYSYLTHVPCVFHSCDQRSLSSPLMSFQYVFI